MLEKLCYMKTKTNFKDQAQNNPLPLPVFQVVGYYLVSLRVISTLLDV